MEAQKIVEELQKQYPGKNIVMNPLENPTEIVCEVDPEGGVAVAVIERSEPHHHLQTTEEYRVLEGDLALYIDGSEKELSEGDQFEVYPGEVHFAIGDETWVDVKSTPPWSPEDHIMEGKMKEFK